MLKNDLKTYRLLCLLEAVAMYDCWKLDCATVAEVHI